MLLGRGLCNELITSPEESYRLLRVAGCDLETSQRRLWPTQGCRVDDYYYYDTQLLVLKSFYLLTVDVEGY